MQENIDPSLFKTYSGTVLNILMAFGYIWIGVKWWLERGDKKKTEQRLADEEKEKRRLEEENQKHRLKIDEFEQLSKLLKLLDEQLDKRERSEKEKDSEIEALELWRETFTDKQREARAVLWSVSEVCREMKKCLDSGDNEKLIVIISEIDAKIVNVRETLK